MTTRKAITSYAREIARVFNPERVVLFGSHARRTATADSDVDLLVIVKHRGRNIDQAYSIRRTIPRTFPLDLVVRTPAEARRRIAARDTFLSEIYRHGKILYEHGN